MNKKSLTITILSLIMLIILSEDIYVNLYLSKAYKTTGGFINNTGLIRVLVQKVSKMEIVGIDSEAFILKTDIIIEDLENDRKYGSNKNKEYREKIKVIKSEWNELKNVLRKYRSEKLDIDRERIIITSEEMFQKTNELVSIAQSITDNKVKYFSIARIATIINILFIFVIILFIEVYVKNKLENKVSNDFLTGAYNRDFFNEYMKRIINNAERYRRKFSLLIFDIDYFKKINDTYGHSTGDYVLKAISEIVKKNIRKSDVFVRIGGDEFIIIFSEINKLSGATIADKIRKIIGENKYIGIESGQVTISMGITDYEEKDTLENIIDKADKALYSAKEKGRNRVCIDKMWLINNLSQKSYMKIPSKGRNLMQNNSYIELMFL